MLLLDEQQAANHTAEDGQIDVLETHEWGGDHETQPERLTPDRVRIPLSTNAAYEALVQPSEPVVVPGEAVTVGEPVGIPAPGEISNTQHSSIDGTVTEVTDRQIVIERS